MDSRLCRDNVLLGKGRVATKNKGGQPRKNKIDTCPQQREVHKDMDDRRNVDMVTRT